MGITNDLYRAARASADMRAASKGPAAVGKRVVRKTVYRHSSRVVRKGLRAFGL